MRWAQKYLGLRIGGEQPCVRFYEQVLKEQFNIDLTLPKDDTWERARAMRDRLLEFFNPIDKGLVITSDLILLTQRSRVFHVGMYIDNGLILHAQKQCVSRLDKLEFLLDNDTLGYGFGGYFRCKK